MGECLTTWDTALLVVEFALNCSVNKSISSSLFKIIICYKPRKPIDLPLGLGDQLSASAN